MKCWSFKTIETVGLTTKTVSLSVIVPEVNRKTYQMGFCASSLCTYNIG